MPSVFTRIMAGELPAHFLWKDDRCVAFLSINPLKPGHSLVVPREEVDHWLDADEGTRDHVMHVAHALGRALMAAYRPVKVGVMFAGLEVPHMHVHVVPIWTVHDMDFANAEARPNAEDLLDAAETVRGSLRTLGYEHVAE